MTTGLVKIIVSFKWLPLESDPAFIPHKLLQKADLKE
jgi:hypothetical protein